MSRIYTNLSLKQEASFFSLGHIPSEYSQADSGSDEEQPIEYNPYMDSIECYNWESISRGEHQVSRLKRAKGVVVFLRFDNIRGEEIDEKQSNVHHSQGYGRPSPHSKFAGVISTATTAVQLMEISHHEAEACELKVEGARVQQEIRYEAHATTENCYSNITWEKTKRVSSPYRYVQTW